MTWRVQVGSDEITVEHDSADASIVFVCAHGAGGNMGDRGMLAASAVMRARGMDVVRFNFPYKEKRSGRPDPMPLLKKTIEAVFAIYTWGLRDAVFLALPPAAAVERLWPQVEALLAGA